MTGRKILLGAWSLEEWRKNEDMPQAMNMECLRLTKKDERS